MSKIDNFVRILLHTPCFLLHCIRFFDFYLIFMFRFFSFLCSNIALAVLQAMQEPQNKKKCFSTVYKSIV